MESSEFFNNLNRLSLISKSEKTNVSNRFRKYRFYEAHSLIPIFEIANFTHRTFLFYNQYFQITFE